MSSVSRTDRGNLKHKDSCNFKMSNNKKFIFFDVFNYVLCSCWYNSSKLWRSLLLVDTWRYLSTGNSGYTSSTTYVIYTSTLYTIWHETNINNKYIFLKKPIWIIHAFLLCAFSQMLCTCVVKDGFVPKRKMSRCHPADTSYIDTNQLTLEQRHVVAASGQESQ